MDQRIFPVNTQRREKERWLKIAIDTEEKEHPLLYDVHLSPKIQEPAAESWGGRSPIPWAGKVDHLSVRHEALARESQQEYVDPRTPFLPKGVNPTKVLNMLWGRMLPL